MDLFREAFSLTADSDGGMSSADLVLEVDITPNDRGLLKEGSAMLCILLLFKYLPIETLEWASAKLLGPIRPKLNRRRIPTSRVKQESQDCN